MDTGCNVPAAKHVNWLLYSGDRREKHLCEAHTAEVREQACESRYRPVKECGAGCQITIGRQ